MARATDRRIGTILVAIVVSAVCAGAAGLPAAGAGPRQRSAHDARAGSELPSLRSRHARTFVTARGTRVTRIYSGAVNYLTGGRWEPIDNTLGASPISGYALRNRANRYSVDFPQHLGTEPVKVASNGAWVAFSPSAGAAPAAPTASGATARYAGVYRDADMAYTAQGDSVKEAITLRSPQAASSYRFKLELSTGLSPRETGAGGIEFVDQAGTVVMSFAPPYMTDAAGAVSRGVTMKLVREGGGYTVEVTADRAWLDGTHRSYPVVIDPTTNVNAGGDDCYLVGGSLATTHFCGYAFNWLDVGGDGGTQPRRTYLKFDLSAIPADAEVIDGDVQIWKEDGSPRAVDLYRLNRSSTGSRTWNSYDGTNSWTTPGGDIPSTPDASATTTVTSGWNHWYARKLVQGWVNKSIPNYGVILKDTNTASLGNVLHFRASEQTGTGPFVEVEWQSRLGVQDRYTMKNQPIADGLGVMTNVANGNLVIQQNDLQIAGAEDLNVDLGRYFNNLDVDGGGGDLGWGWNMGTAYDYWLDFEGGGSTVAVNGPSGFWAPYDKQPDGSYQPPPGANATLTKAADGTYSMVDNGDDRVFHFDTTGKLTSVSNPEGNSISFAYGGPSGKLSQITDTGLGVTRVTYNASGTIDTVTDPAGQVWRYGYSGNALTSVTRPDGKVTRYEWDSGLDPTKITDVDGKVWTFSYDSQYRVTSIKQVTDTVAGTGPTTTFTYGAPTASCTSYPSAIGKTVETDPDGTVSTYCYDAADTVLNKPTDYQTCIGEAPNDPSCATWWRDDPPAVEPGVINAPDPVDDGISDYSPCYAEEAAFDCDMSSDAGEPVSAAAAPADPLVYGIADDGDVSTFTYNNLFKDLKVRRIRRIIPWDIVRRDKNGKLVDPAGYKKFYDVWKESWSPNSVHPNSQNLDIMVTFRHSNVIPNVAPSPTRYAKWVKAFKRRFGNRVSAMGAWNEPNEGHEPTRAGRAGAKRAADYAFLLRRDICKPPACTAVAGEFEFRGKWKQYMSAYISRIAGKPSSAPRPTVWGAHPYGDAMHHSTTLTDYFLANVPTYTTAVWLSEVGAHIDANHIANPTQAQQAADEEYLVNTVARRTGGPPIKRLYYYEMWEQNKFISPGWDTGLLTDGNTTEGGGVKRTVYDKYSVHTHDHPRG
jgi:YD repeat-containing protein